MNKHKMTFSIVAFVNRDLNVSSLPIDYLAVSWASKVGLIIVCVGIIDSAIHLCEEIFHGIVCELIKFSMGMCIGNGQRVKRFEYFIYYGYD